MADVSQIMLVPNIPGIEAKGNRNDTNLRASFPTSPLPDYEGQEGIPGITDAERRSFYQENVLDGTRTGGHGVASFNLDFEGTLDDPRPNIAAMIPGSETGKTTDGKAFGSGGGAPTTQYIPPLTSPGPGVTTPSGQPAYTGERTGIDEETGELVKPLLHGSGLGGLTDPNDTTPNIAGQTLLGSYVSGRSYGGSDGVGTTAGAPTTEEA